MCVPRPVLQPYRALIQEKYLQDRIKINGKTGVLGDAVTLSRTDDSVTVTADKGFSKRSLKYYTKKYLASQSLQDSLRVVASDRKTYEIKYYRVVADEAEE